MRIASADFGPISYFNDYITTDTLDDAITEIPIEMQLLKEENCGESKNLNSSVISELKDLLEEDQKIDTSISHKINVKKQLESQIEAQIEILVKLRRMIL